MGSSAEIASPGGIADGVERVGGLAHVGGENAVLGADGANGFGVVGELEGF